MVGLGQVSQTVPVVTAVLEHALFGIALGFGFLPWQSVKAGPSVSRRVPVV
jgi:hypothetical protein